MNEQTEFHEDTGPFYKYRSLSLKRGSEDSGRTDKEYTEEIFTKQELFFNVRSKFNDPFECRAFVSFDAPEKTKLKCAMKRIVKEKGAQYWNSLSRNEKEIEARKKYLVMEDRVRGNELNLPTDIKKSLDETRFYCVSSKRDDLLEWAHYADGHGGICLEFTITTEEQAEQTPLIVSKVQYSEDANIPVIQFYHDGEENGETRLKRWIEPMLLTKAKCWEYEQEYRAIAHRPVADGKYKFPPDQLTGVILGCKISDKNREDVLKWVRGYPTEIKVYRASINPEKYRLDIAAV